MFYIQIMLANKTKLDIFVCYHETNKNEDLISVSFSLYDSGNHIFQGLAAGIAVNENGRGLITGLFDCSTIFLFAV